MSREIQLESVKNRLELLHDVLVFDSDVSKRFKINERILINQERGSLYDFVNYLSGNIEHEATRKLQVPLEVELKIQIIAKEIQKEGIKQIEVNEPIILKQE